jgi:hypothetical protein
MNALFSTSCDPDCHRTGSRNGSLMKGGLTWILESKLSGAETRSNWSWLGMSSLCSVSAVFSHARLGIAGPGKRLSTESFGENEVAHTSRAALISPFSMIDRENGIR